MKKTLTAIALLAGAVSGYSQGQVSFYNYSTAAGLHAAIYPAQSVGSSTYTVTYGGSTGSEEIGQSTAAIEKPSGTKTYVGTGLQGTAFDAQLLAGPSDITSLGGTSASNPGVGLVPVGSIANFHTQTGTAGMINGVTSVVLPTESYFSPGDQIAVAIAAWSSAYPSLSAAEQSGVSGVWGISHIELTSAAGGLTAAPSAPENLPTTLSSFSLAVTTPEPSTIALGVLGASSLLFRRRK